MANIGMNTEALDGLAGNLQTIINQIDDIVRPNGTLNAVVQQMAENWSGDACDAFLRQHETIGAMLNTVLENLNTVHSQVVNSINMTISNDTENASTYGNFQ